MEVADKIEAGCGKPLALRAELIPPDSSSLLSVAATILILCNLDTRTLDTAATLHCVREAIPVSILATIEAKFATATSSPSGGALATGLVTGWEPGV